MKRKAYEAADRAWAETFQQKYVGSPTLWGVTSAISEAAQGAGWWGDQQEEEEIAAQVLKLRGDVLKN